MGSIAVGNRLFVVEKFRVLNLVKDGGKIFPNHTFKFFLQDKRLLIDLRTGMIVHFAIIPTKLNVIKSLFDDLVSPFVILPPYLIEVDGLLHNVFVIAQS